MMHPNNYNNKGIMICIVLTLQCIVFGNAASSNVWQRDFINGPSNEISLRAEPTRIEDGEVVRIFYENTNASSKDYIGMSCGPKASTLDFLAVQIIDNKLSSVRFEGLYMMRCDYVFEYISFNTVLQKHVAVGSITVPMNERWTTPKQGHVALTDRDDEMVVMYVSSSNSFAPKVQYGTSMDLASAETATGNSTTYTAADMCHSPASLTQQTYFRNPGYMHKIVLKSLLPGKTYYYRYGNRLDGWSSVSSFQSKPVIGSTGVKFIAYADMGASEAPAATDTAERVYQDVVKPDGGYNAFLLHFGDISYARGQGFIWEHYFKLIEPYARKVPYMVSIGNHEYDHGAGGDRDPSNAPGNGFHPSWGNFGNDSSGECAVPMVNRWHVPSNGNSMFWYSFNYGDIHVIQMSSEHNFTEGSDQYKWIQRDLETVDRSVTPWVILTAHRMMYTTQLGEFADNFVAMHFRQSLEPLLKQYRVNLVMVGHQHSYERSCPVYETRCVNKGTVHITVGSAGAKLESFGFSHDFEWSLVQANEYGYLRIQSSNETMHLEFVLNRNGQVFDEVDIPLWN